VIYLFSSLARFKSRQGHALLSNGKGLRGDSEAFLSRRCSVRARHGAEREGNGNGMTHFIALAGNMGGNGSGAQPAQSAGLAKPKHTCAFEAVFAPPPHSH